MRSSLSVSVCWVMLCQYMQYIHVLWSEFSEKNKLYVHENKNTVNGIHVI